MKTVTVTAITFYPERGLARITLEWDGDPAESQRAATVLDRDGVAAMLQQALPHDYRLGDLRLIRGRNRIDVEAKYGLEASEEEIIDRLIRAAFTLGPDVPRSGKTPGK